MHRPSRSPRRRARALLAAVALAALAAPAAPPAAADPVRVFAVGHKQRVADARTVETFRSKMRALVDARLRTPDLVQPGLLDVAGLVRPRDPSAPALAVVHFPEDTGLIAGLIGSRGEAARGASAATEAFALLLAAYADPIAYYTERDPELASQPLRGLGLALTDVLYRAVFETFRDIARDHGIYVSVSLNVADARRVEAADDPGLVARLRDPDEPERGYAYVADGALPSNRVWLFDPSGEVLVPGPYGAVLRSPSETGGVITGSVRKAYLTQIEQSLDKPGGGLSLAPGAVRELDVLDTPIGAIAVVISKDAWMPDVNERFDAKGANLTLQSEAFSSWAYAPVPWDPDVFKESGFGNLQSRAGFLFNVAPSMTGNLFDVTFDGQSAILEKRRDKRPPPIRSAESSWIGQPADGGFVAIAPWIVADPLPGEPGGATLAARRQALAAAGALLLPGSGVSCAGPLAVGACENGYREWILAADLEVPPGPGTSGLPHAPDATARRIDHGRRPTAFGASRPIAASGRGRQRHPAIAAAGDLVVVAWDDTRDGPIPHVHLALSRDGGSSFSAPIKASARAPEEEPHELLPDVAIAGDEIRVVWQTFDRPFDDDRGRIELARFDRRGRRLGPDLRVDDGHDAGAPAGRWRPAIATLPDGAPIVAWIDERDPGPDGVAFERVYAARGTLGARGLEGFAPAVRVDRGAPVPNADGLDNEWAPTIAVGGDGAVHVAWVDFRNYNWDVFTARSSDGGRSFGESVRLNGYPLFERICSGPHALAIGAHDVLLAWTDIRAQQPDTDLYYTRSADGGATFATDRPLAAAAARVDLDLEPPVNQSHVALATDDERIWAAWQDDRDGNPDILFAAIGSNGEAAGAIDRVDDTGDGPSGQYRPALAVAGAGGSARCVVAWEDDREGRLRVYVASRRCGSPPARLPTLAVDRR